MKITRRKLAAVALAPALLAQTPPSQTPPPIPSNPEEELAAARAQNQRNSQALDKFAVPIATEPATVFKV